MCSFLLIGELHNFSVVQDLENLFHVLRDEFEVINYGRRSLDSQAKPKAKSEDAVKLPAVRDHLQCFR